MWSPLGEEPLNQAARWQPEPATRGTFSIVSTSLTTLILCVWTALHLNIPENKKASRNKWRKAGWLLVGLFMPEVVATIACQQWLKHRDLTKAMKNSLDKLSVTRGQDVGLETNHIDEIDNTQEDIELLQRQIEQEHSRRRRYHWTPVHSYYAIMGGFVFDNSRNPETLPFRGGREQVAIHPDLLLWLAENEPDLIPDISIGYITDKSKANGLAKFLVCAQAGWFGVQVVARLGQGLAVTLLELNVFAHVVCALLTYAVWWNKPLDIDEPTAIYTDDLKAASICAAFWSRSSLGDHTPLVVQRGAQGAVEPVWGVGNKHVTVDTVVLSPRRAQELWSQCFDGSSVVSQQGTQYFSNQEHNPEHVLLRLNIDRIVLDDWESRILVQVDAALVMSQLERSEILLRTGSFGPGDRFYVAFKNYHLQRHLCAYSHPAGLNLISLVSRDFKAHKMRPRIHTWHSLEEIENITPYVGLFTAANVLYGGWHLIAWNGPFRTATEGILWKVSAIGVSMSLILDEALLWWVGQVIDRDDRIEAEQREATSDHETNIDDGINHENERKRKAFIPLFLDYSFSALFFFLFFLGVLGSCLLVFSRTYLVLEPFISLAFAPDAVFVVTQWSTYFPHIG